MLKLPLTMKELRLIEDLIARKWDEFYGEDTRQTDSSVYDAERSGNIGRAAGIRFQADVRRIAEKGYITIRAASEVMALTGRSWTSEIAEALRDHLAEEFDYSADRCVAMARSRAERDPHQRGDLLRLEDALRRKRNALFRDFRIQVLQSELQEQDSRQTTAADAAASDVSYDVFISHASEDKDDFVRPLAEALRAEGMSVWYDEYMLTIGDDLYDKINEGLTASRYGILVLSPGFFDAGKKWPKLEASGLLGLENADRKKRILPIWHKLDETVIAKHSPLLVNRVAWKSSQFTPEQLAAKFRAEFVKTS